MVPGEERKGQQRPLCFSRPSAAPEAPSFFLTFSGLPTFRATARQASPRVPSLLGAGSRDEALSSDKRLNGARLKGGALEEGRPMLLDFPRGAPDKLLIKEQQKNDSNIALCSGRAGSLWW